MVPRGGSSRRGPWKGGRPCVRAIAVVSPKDRKLMQRIASRYQRKINNARFVEKAWERFRAAERDLLTFIDGELMQQLQLRQNDYETIMDHVKAMAVMMEMHRRGEIGEFHTDEIHIHLPRGGRYTVIQLNKVEGGWRIAHTE